MVAGNIVDFVYLTSIVGRDREIREALALAGETRLLTVTGVGGAGKTRFGVELAERIRRLHGGEVWMLPLSRAENLDHAVRSTFGDIAGSAAELITFLRPRSAVVLLDGGEHLLRESRAFAIAALRQCSGLRIIFASRQPLVIESEVVYPLAVLRFSDPMAPSEDPSDAARLFLRRASTAVSSTSTKGQLPTIEKICARVDGLPLSIELAAARLAVLEPVDILDRLREPFELLRRADGDDDQQLSLHECIAWSYGLCTDAEQRLWRHLAVFEGAFSLDAIEFIAARVLPSGSNALDLAHSLVSKSIMTRVPDQFGLMFSMLSPIRDLGCEFLTDGGEEERARRLHLDWWRIVLKDMASGRVSPSQPRWQSRLRRSYLDIRAALRFALDSAGDPRMAIDLLVPMWRLLWISRGGESEMLGLLERALELIGGDESTDPDIVQAVALRGYLRGLTRGKEAGDGDLAWAMQAARSRGFALSEVTVDVARATLLGDGPDAIEIFERAYERVSRDAVLFDCVVTATRLPALLILMHDRLGNVQRARELFSEFDAYAERAGKVFDRSYVLFGLGTNALARGEADDAIAFARASISVMSRMSITKDVVDSAVTIVGALALQGRFSRAAHGLGIADVLGTQIGRLRENYSQPSADRRLIESRLRDRLDPESYRRWYDKGRALSIPRALTVVLGHPAEPGPVASRADGLTAREKQVRELLLEGLSNREIAARLYLSVRTVEGHVRNLLLKSGLTSRVQLLADHWRR